MVDGISEKTFSEYIIIYKRLPNYSNYGPNV